MATKEDTNLIDEIYDTAVDIAKKAGEMIRTTFFKEKSIETKENFADLVTETDQNVEKFVLSAVRDKFPSHQFIGEESVAEGKKAEWTDQPTWIVDPIDGTTNFVHRIPYTCISIGVSIKQEMVVGVVFAPILDKMYTAKKGHGAFCNGIPIKVTGNTELKQCIVISEVGTSRDEEILTNKLMTMKNVISLCHGLRYYGSAALNMCCVASGWGDAYYEYGIHVWDVAAGVVIVREAGGYVRSIKEEKLDLLNREILCSASKSLATEISPLIIPCDFERD